MVTPEPTTPMRAGDLALSRGAAASDGGGRADHRAGGDPPRADAGEPRARGRGLDHRLAVRRPAADHAGRDRAGAPPHASRRCASSSRGTAPIPRSTASAPRCSPAISSSPRPGPGTITATRPRSRWCGSTGSTSRSSSCSSASFAEAGADDMQAVTPARRRQLRALRPQPAAGRLEARGQDLAGVQLPLRAHPRGARSAEPQRRARPLSRAQAALCQPGERRVRDADDRHLHAAAAGGLREPALPLDRRHRLCRASRATGESRGSATQVLRWEPRDIFVVPSWMPHTPPCRRARRCCSASPTGRCRKSSACGARRAATLS